MAAHGVARDRISVHAGGSHADFLGQYRLVDAIVDTVPYSGGLTTCEALWMGVPVLTVPGDRIAARHATAHLRTVGLDACVASDEADLVRRAVALLNNPEQLREWRGTLRARVQQSPLVDAAAFARDFVDLVHAAWDRAVEGAR